MSENIEAETAAQDASAAPAEHGYVEDPTLGDVAAAELEQMERGGGGDDDDDAAAPPTSTMTLETADVQSTTSSATTRSTTDMLSDSPAGHVKDDKTKLTLPPLLAGAVPPALKPVRKYSSSSNHKQTNKKKVVDEEWQDPPCYRAAARRLHDHTPAARGSMQQSQNFFGRVTLILLFILFCVPFLIWFGIWAKR